MLGRRLARLLSLSLAPVAAGCGIDTSGFTPLPCSSDQRVILLDGLQPAEPIDYLELWEGDDFSPEAALRESSGTKCLHATDITACEGAVAAATSATGFGLGQCVDICQRYYLVVNRGDDVTVIDSDAGLAEFLGDIDAPADAVIAALAADYNVACGEVDHGGVTETADGFEVIATRVTSSCDPIETTQFRLGVSTDGAVTELESVVIDSESGACIGRRPPGLAARSRILHRARPRADARALGRYFREVAALEAASVHAFATLRTELESAGAPSTLIEQAERARLDEIRHARVTGVLARRFGAAAARARVKTVAPRSLEEMALDNAAEGCVRETFGALVGLHQAVSASDPTVRKAMATIAADEVRHASLSWAIDAWARGVLPPSTRRALDDARDSAMAALTSSAARPVAPALRRIAGLPPALVAERLSRAFAAAAPTWV
ncbi:MAG: hypothetical protein U0271_03035 [Polyangiaceae bacterium]